MHLDVRQTEKGNRKRQVMTPIFGLEIRVLISASIHETKESPHPDFSIHKIKESPQEIASN
jgi:hypothetical protein